MVLEKFSSSLKNVLSKIAKSIFVDEKLVNEIIKEIQRALLQADVNVNLVFELSEKIRQRALKEKTPSGITQREYLIKIVYEELTNLLGKEKEEIKIERKKPFKIMMVGLFGSGKTTTIGKLANYYKKRGYKIATLGLDVHRPAAPQQLKQLSQQVQVPFYIDEKEKNPIKIYNEFKNEFDNYDILIIDTAGRDALSKDLIEEIKELNDKIKPDEKVLVISGDIGQAAQKQAESFNEACDVTSVIVSKLDGTARGGGALAACSATNAKIKFIGVGEKLEDLETYNPEGFVSRILGMGDIEALLEKAKESITEEKAQDLSKKLLKGDFSLIDLYEQMESMKKMGPLNKIVDMIPGFGQLKLPDNMLKVQEGKLEKWKHAMNSMTKEELEDPDIISTSRIARISKGSGVTANEIRELLKQYKQSKKLIKLMKGQDPSKIMKKFQGKMPFKI